MPELLLHGRNIPRLGDEVLPHGMPGTMRRPPLHLRDTTNRIPDGIDHPHGEPPRALGHGRRHQEQRRRGPPRRILVALVPQIILESLAPSRLI